jgi:hypothetical protein
LKQTIQSEICKQTAVLEEKLTAEITKQSAESAKQTASLVATMDSKLATVIEGLKSELRYENEKLAESLIARSESANAAIREELNAKISSEIRVVSDKIDDVSKDTENKITTLNNTIKSVHECMNERLNAHVVQNRKETDRQGQEITAASNSLLANIREHKEQMEVTIENLSYEISKSKEYVDSKFSTVSGEIQDIKQHSAAEVSRLSATLRDSQSKLVTGTSDRTSPAVPVRVDVRSGAVQQVDSVINTAGSNNALPSVPGENGVNGCSRSVCTDVTRNSVINQPTNSCSYGNVNVTSDLHAKSAEVCELTLPTFSDSTKQVPIHFIRDLDQYFNLRQTPDELRLPLVFRAIQEPFAKQWLCSSFDKLKGYDEFKKALTELVWNPSHQASIGSSIYLDRYNPNSGESYMDHYIRYANLASTLDPPMTEMDLLSAVISHFEPRVQQGLIRGRNIKDLEKAGEVLGRPGEIMTGGM